MDKAKSWDVFVSHASEDKAEVVLPLSRLLERLGLKVWLDVGELKVGDSLSKSIDEGLARSRFGILVLSKAFLRKDWPDYELRSLIAKELGREKVILPVWHDIERDELLAYSPNLADKKGLSTNRMSLEDIALELVEVIRPDLSERILRKLIYLRQRNASPIELVEAKSLKKSRRRHAELPTALVWRIRGIRAALIDVYPLSFEDWIDGFLRDSHPTQEVEMWEHFACVFREIVWEGDWTLEDKKLVFGTLFPMLMGMGKPSLEGLKLTPIQKKIVEEALAGPRATPGEIPIFADTDDEGDSPSAAPDLEDFTGPAALIDQELLEELARRST